MDAWPPHACSRLGVGWSIQETYMLVTALFAYFFNVVWLLGSQHGQVAHEGIAKDENLWSCRQWSSNQILLPKPRSDLIGSLWSIRFTSIILNLNLCLDVLGYSNYYIANFLYARTHARTHSLTYSQMLRLVAGVFDWSMLDFTMREKRTCSRPSTSQSIRFARKIDWCDLHASSTLATSFRTLAFAWLDPMVLVNQLCSRSSTRYRCACFNAYITHQHTCMRSS